MESSLSFSALVRQDLQEGVDGSASPNSLVLVFQGRVLCPPAGATLLTAFTCGFFCLCSSLSMKSLWQVLGRAELAGTSTLKIQANISPCVLGTRTMNRFTKPKSHNGRDATVAS